MSELFEIPTDLVEASALVSRTDAKGKIIYANRKFCEVSGWSEEEIIGKDHHVVNSGYHPKSFWTDMYGYTTKRKKIWNAVVTNRAKDGRIYHVDTFIKAEFDDQGELEGYISVRQDVTRLIDMLTEVNRKNAYLEHAAKILRHDMHSGINVYMPRGVSSLKRRLPKEAIEKYKLESPLKLIKEGLIHTQRVYKGVKEFTNLVRENKTMDKELCNVKEILKSFLATTSYNDQVLIDDLPELLINESLFCTAIDNLIRNGLKYNDSESKLVRVYMSAPNVMTIQDNGRGMSQEQFTRWSHPYIRREDQKESGTGLGLSICIAILNEHGFSITCEKLPQGTMLKVKLC